MTSYRSLSLVLYKRSKKKYNISPAALIFWTGTSILLEKAGKRDGDTKRRIDDSHDVLRGSFYLSHHGGRSFTSVQDDALLLVSLWCFPLPIVSNAFPQSSFRTGVRMLFEKAGRQNGDTEWRIYYTDDILPLSSPQQQILCCCFVWHNRKSYASAFNSQLTVNS